MSFLTERFESLKKEANLQSFLDKEEIKDKGRERQKLESKKSENDEDENIRQIQEDTEQLAIRQQREQQLANRAGLGVKILKGYFAYKTASLLCNTFCSRDGLDSDLEQKAENGQLDISALRAEQIEQVRDQFDSINAEAKSLGISQNDIFTQEDKTNLTDLAAISRDHDNPQQAELYAAKCEQLGLDQNQALEAFQQDQNLDVQQNRIDKNREREQSSFEIEM
jgi:hypothetical protein